MHPDPPHYFWHWESPGWLHRKHAAGEPGSRDDIARLASDCDENLNDPLVQHYVRLVLDNRLKSRIGRKPTIATDVPSSRFLEKLPISRSQS